MSQNFLDLIHAAGINTKQNSPLEKLMSNLVKDLVELENNKDEDLTQLIAIYETLYKQLTDIARNT